MVPETSPWVPKWGLSAQGRARAPGSPVDLGTNSDSLRIGQRVPVPRLRSGRSLSDRSFRYLFGIDLDEIDERFFRSTVRHSEPTRRSNNRTRRTRRYVPEGDAPEKLFHLSVRGIQLQPPPRNEGSDSENEGGEGGEGAEGERDIDGRLTYLWRQFIQDVTQKVANRKNSDEDGYCKLTADERASGDIEGLYKNLCLSDFFNDCQWRKGGEQEWNSIFDHLFPISDKPAKAQNYRQCNYYKEWLKIKDGAANREALETIRRALKSKFSTLLWFPYAQADRIWVTRPYAPRFKKFVNPGGSAPWVICRREPLWNTREVV